MKLITSTAIALAAGLAAVPAAAQMGSYSAPPPPPPQNTPRATSPESSSAESAGPKYNISSKARPAIVDLQKSVNANDYASVPAKVAAAQAVAQTKDDRYVIGELQLKAAVAANDNNGALAAADAIAASGYVDAGKTSELYNAVGVKFYNAKQYDKSTALFQKAAALAPQNPEPLKLLAESYNAQGQRAQAAATLEKAIQVSGAAGQKPEEAIYKRAVGMAYDAKAPNAVELGREWLSAYPSPDSWRNSIAIYRNMEHPDTSALIDVLRLQRATNSLQGVGDYHAYAYEAANEANYGEAKAVIAEGVAAGKISETDPVIREVTSILKTKPAPTAAELATAEKGASVPNAFIRVGDRYYGAGNYAKAAELYGQGLAKGADANEANLRLGEALALSGNKAGAAAAFNKVAGPLAQIAKFWMIYAQHGA